jgi:uncharacterized protein involved in exopolysaccharide biosynthesis
VVSDPTPVTGRFFTTWGAGIDIQRGDHQAKEPSTSTTVRDDRRRPFIATVLLAMLAALGASLLTTPTYAASTQLFVSTTGSVADMTAATYQGGLFSQQEE